MVSAEIIAEYDARVPAVLAHEAPQANAPGALAWLRAHEVLGMPRLVGLALAGASALLFVVVALSYGLKLLRHREAVLEELHHPIKLSFFPALLTPDWNS